MTIPSSGPVSLSDIQTEFGGSNPISLSEYYVSGGIINPGVFAPNGIPSSGAISLEDFRGAEATHQYINQGSANFTFNAKVGFSIDYFNGFLTATLGYWNNGQQGGGSSVLIQATSTNRDTYFPYFSEVAQVRLTTAGQTVYGTTSNILAFCYCIFGNPILAYGNPGPASGNWMMAARWNGGNSMTIILNPSRNGTGDTGTSISMSNLGQAMSNLSGGASNTEYTVTF
jgi:hypothetical protein